MMQELEAILSSAVTVLSDKTRTRSARYENACHLLARVSDLLASAWPKDEHADLEEKEFLFECLMHRFDALTPHKEHVRTLYAMMASHPDVAFAQVLQMHQSFARTLSTQTLCAMPVCMSYALTWVYSQAFPTWLGDDTPDLAPTMARIDGNLTSVLSLQRTLAEKLRI
ncbi:hypothetical protein EIL50_01770 [bacterium NHP-B]|nr:hypothetical protein EIL50_01770 [bacterium NHP-B]